MIFRLRYGLLMLLATCLQSAIAAPISTALTKEGYVASGENKGVVLIAVNWARRWQCGGFENAQLQSMAFDLATKPGKGKSDQPDIALEPSSTLLAGPSFVHYAFIVEPGEYQLSAFKLKVAKSIANIAYMKGDRSTLLVGGKSKAGSFTAVAGEIVYVGHFAVDCGGVPMPWRFYPEDRLGFDHYLKNFAAEFPGLPVEKAKFRLFQTETMGKPFSLE